MNILSCHMLNRTKGEQNGLCAQQREPVSPQMTALPIAPQHRARRCWLLGEWFIGWGSGGSQWPEHRAHAPRFAGGGVFLALCAQRTGATMADAGGIEHPQRAIALRSTLLRGERVIAGTPQRAPSGRHEKVAR